MDNRLLNWKEKVSGNQQSLSLCFADRQWDALNKTPKEVFVTNLHLKVAYAFFTKGLIDCTTEEEKIIKFTASKIIELSGTTEVLYLSYVYIFILTKSSKECNAVVFRTKGGAYNLNEYFIEPQPNGRVYCGWTDYLRHNKLPRGVMCYPKNGLYQQKNGKVMVEFQKTPSCNMTFKILDIISVGGSILSGGVLSTAIFFPAIALPVVICSGVALGATTVYSTGRSVYQLCDRDNHHQSISLANDEARSLYINMLVTVVSNAAIGGAAAGARIIANATSLESVVFHSFKILQYTSLAVNAFGILHNVITLIVKFKNGDLKSKDIKYFSEICYFICNIVMNQVVAEQLISVLFDSPNTMVINIFNMVRNTCFELEKGVIKSLDVGFILNILTGPAVSNVCLRQINLDTTTNFFNLFRDVIRKRRNNEISMSDACVILFEKKEILFKFVDEIKSAVLKVEVWLDTFWKDFEINKKRIFKNSSRALAMNIAANVDSVIDNLNIDDKYTKVHCEESLLKLATKFADEVNCNSDVEFVEICKFLANKIMPSCTNKLIVKTSESQLNICDKLRVYNEVTNKIKVNNSFRSEIKEEYKKSIQNAVNYDKRDSLKPLVYQSDVGEIYMLSQPFAVFDQFVYDTASELLNVPNILEKGSFYYSDSDTNDVSLLTIAIEGKSVIFCYTANKIIEDLSGIIVSLKNI